MTVEELKKLAEECGFDHVGTAKVSSLKFRDEVRDACKANRCGRYDKSWSCPPGIGDISESLEKAKKFEEVVIIQSTGILEDKFDVEMMMETEQVQKERFYKLMEKVAETEDKGSYLGMSCGSCNLCEKCTYPDAPCRFPDKVFPSMEAYGLVVTEVCNASEGTKYYYGDLTMTYTSCVLI